MANFPLSEQMALLVIDMQEALFEYEMPIYDADGLLSTINDLIERAHRAGTTVVFFQHINKGILRKDAAGWRLHPLLITGASDLCLEKHHGNGFQETALHTELQSRGIDTLVITGLTTHGCVKATCLGALENGYRAILVADGHSSYHKDAPRIAREWNKKLGAQGVEVCPAAEIEFPVR
jgi:nicotinamidase-related amidase